jgi:hypothetical protein
MSFLFAVLVSLGDPGPLTDDLTRTQQPPHPAVIQFQKLDVVEQCDYAFQLAKEGNHAALKAIYSANVRNASTAAMVEACTLKGPHLVAFCKSFPVGSEHWNRVFFLLRSQPREDVIDYIREMATSKSNEVRARCYDICDDCGWDDLLEVAEQDGDNNATLIESLLHSARKPGDPIQSARVSYIEARKAAKSR